MFVSCVHLMVCCCVEPVEYIGKDHPLEKPATPGALESPVLINSIVPDIFRQFFNSTSAFTIMLRRLQVNATKVAEN